jgi:hypothetical protein
MRGIIVAVRPILVEKRLRVVARVLKEDRSRVDAFLPDREVAALVPRSVLLGQARRAPKQILKTISSIIKRMVAGRPVRLWQYGESYYFSFLSWRPITFESGREAQRANAT